MFNYLSTFSMSDQLSSGQFNGCTTCAKKAELIKKLSTEIDQLAEKNEERLNRIFLRIENCERMARELGLYKAK